MNAPGVIGCEHDTLFEFGACLAQERRKVGHLVAQFCGRNAKKRRNGERVEVYPENSEIFADAEPPERLRLTVNAGTEGKLRLFGFQDFIELAFEMEYQFGAAIGHRPMEIGLAVGEVMFQHPEEAYIPR